VFRVSPIRDIINNEIYKKINIMYIIVLFLPLLSFFFVGLFGKYFGRILCKLLAVSCIFVTFLLSLFIFYEIGLSHSVVEIELNN
jgi:NADH:ubiquinone oxidoreductase subunit 5 (subunit L)/multisubunit Na+/H+ antiporter MnhA subunit